MKLKRINIGTYEKEEALRMRDEIKRFAKLREQKIQVIFKGRGKKLDGYNDGNMNASHLAIYLVVHYNGDIPQYESESTKLTPQQRLDIIERLVLKNNTNINYIKDILRYGFNGYKNYNDAQLVNDLLS